MPPAVLDVVETASSIVETPPKPRDYSHLQRYHFQPGHAPLPKSGRPKGSKSFESVLVRASNKLAKAYVKTALTGNSTLLVDSRKVFLPIENEEAGQASTIILMASDLRSSPLPVVDHAVSSPDVLAHAVPSLPQHAAS